MRWARCARPSAPPRRASTVLLATLPEALTTAQRTVLEGAFNSVSRELGNTVGYDSIVASARTPRILHWMRNTGVVRNGDLLLVDAGVEVDSCIPPTSPAPSRRTAGSPICRSACTRPCLIPSRPVSKPRRWAPRIAISITPACA